MVTCHCWVLMFVLLVTILETSIANEMKLELIHRHSLGKGRMLNPLVRLHDLLNQDRLRYQAILHKLTTKTNTRRSIIENPNKVPIEMPLISGSDYRAGQYFVNLKVGTPPQQFLMIVDTGSDLTWINCQQRCHKPGLIRNSNHRRVFCADRSSSFKTFPCSSKACADLGGLLSLQCPNTHTPTTQATPCAFDYIYGDGTVNAAGIFANETVTVQLNNGQFMKLNNVLVGCTETSTVKEADGLLGLGYSKYAFALDAADKLGGKFSYCLVDHFSNKNVSNYLVLGTRTRLPDSIKKEMQYTKLLLGVINTHYAVDVNGISLGGVMLKIPNEIWRVNKGVGGTFLDSGTTLTFLTQPAYEPVVNGLKRSLSKFKKQEFQGLDCFASTGFKEYMVPRLEFHFADGAKFGPPVKSYIIDVKEGVKCLGFVSAVSPGSNIIGNIMQQEHVWEFDLVKSQLGFAASTCI